MYPPDRAEGLYATVGCHPCRATEPDEFPGGATAYFDALDQLIVDSKGKGKALFIGECGLDYDRLHLASKEAQLKCVALLPPRPLCGMSSSRSAVLT